MFCDDPSAIKVLRTSAVPHAHLPELCDGLATALAELLPVELLAPPAYMLPDKGLDPRQPAAAVTYGTVEVSGTNSTLVVAACKCTAGQPKGRPADCNRFIGMG